MKLLLRRLEVAETFGARLRGLIGRRLGAGEGLLIRPCRAVHMLGVPAAIDAVFLDAGGRVLRVARLRPWLGYAHCPGAAAVLEVPAGAAAGVRPGDRLDLPPRG